MLLTQSPRTTALLQPLSSAVSSASYAHRSSFLRILQLTHAEQKGEVSHLVTVSQKRPVPNLCKAIMFSLFYTWRTYPAFPKSIFSLNFVDRSKSFGLKWKTMETNIWPGRWMAHLRPNLANHSLRNWLKKCEAPSPTQNGENTDKKKGSLIFKLNI